MKTKELVNEGSKKEKFKMKFISTMIRNEQRKIDLQELAVLRELSSADLKANHGGESVSKEFNKIANNNTLFAVTGM